MPSQTQHKQHKICHITSLTLNRLVSSLLQLAPQLGVGLQRRQPRQALGQTHDDHLLILSPLHLGQVGQYDLRYGWRYEWQYMMMPKAVQMGWYRKRYRWHLNACRLDACL